MKSPKLAAVLLLTEVVQICADGMSALFVVGTPPSVPLYADEPYKAHLEKQGYSVVLVKDTDVTEFDCQSHDIMLISASISGSAVGTKLNKCPTPQMIWESRLFSLNGMSANVEEVGSGEADRVTSAFFHENHEAAWVTPEQVPPMPTGPSVTISAEGATWLGEEAGTYEMWTVADIGMNYMTTSWLGEGAKVVATFPRNLTKDFLYKPDEEKATLYYYEKGGKLYGDFGASPAFRIAWPFFGGSWGTAPSCEEVASLACTNDACQKNCQTTSQIIASGVDPMPLSSFGMALLDCAISKLTEEARKRPRTQQLRR